jgi:phosphoglycolate phosphatase
LEYSTLEQYDHIIWDWNGTLLDDAAVCVQVLNKILVMHGKPEITLVQYRASFGFPVEDFYRQLGFDFAKDSYDALADEYISLYRQRQFECPLHEGVAGVLEYCLRLGITQSILSAYQQDLLAEAVACFGLASFFVRLAGRTDYFAQGKVAEGLRLIQDLDLDPSRVLMIGDTLHDAQVSKALGIGCVLIGNGHQAASRLESSGCRMLASIRRVPAFLAGRADAVRC